VWVASHPARLEHRIDDLTNSVLPDVSEALTTALIDLADGGSMLDAIEALERQSAVRLELVDLQLERELILLRLQTLDDAAPARGDDGPLRIGRR
jgi:hypothetical protein